MNTKTKENIIDNLPSIIAFSILGCFVLTIIIVGYYEGIDREKNTWYQDAIILDKTTDGLGDSSCILQGEDGKRYSVYCNKYLVGDKVKLKMIKDNSNRIIELALHSHDNVEVKP